MAKHYVLPVLILALTAGVMFFNGCGKEDPINAQQVNRLWEDQVVNIDQYITRIETIDDSQKLVDAVNQFARKLEELVPQFKRCFLEYPAFKQRTQKESEEESELSPETLAKQEAMAKLAAVWLFTENIIQMQLSKFKQHPAMEDARKKLLEIEKTLDVEESLRKEHRL